MATAKPAKISGTQWPDWMKPGVRVVRGPDFRATVKDPKATNLGTLSYVPKNAADNRVHVVWDTGQERNYSSGFNGQYELRAYDLQQVGIIHKDVMCAACNVKPIRGIRYHCPISSEDLCSECYHNDRHAVTHAFERYDTPTSDRVTLPPRQESQALNLHGVFVKTQVIRGPHWNYTGSDGESGHGTVKAFIEEKDNGWVRVLWDVGKELHEYRFGAEGFVDVVASKVSLGGKVYADHLPFLGIMKLKLGDKVRVNMSLTDFKKLQKKANIPGGWKDEMNQCLADVGTVMEFLYAGDMAKVQYLDGNIHIVATDALFRIGGFCEKDAVEIIRSKTQLQNLQEGHGGCSPQMEQACGKYGRLLQIQKDGDMLVLVNGSKFVFSPSCCVPVTDFTMSSRAPPVPMEESDDEEAEQMVAEGDCVPGRRLVSNPDDDVKDKQRNVKDFSEGFGSMYSNIKRNQDVTNQGNNMFEAFTKADLDQVLTYIAVNKQLVDFKLEGRTILHLACHEGYHALVTALIDAGADMSMEDDDGDTPLHYAAFGKQPDCVQELLQNAANPNCQNANGLTPLLIAIDHPDVDSVQCLVFNNADVSLKAEDDDTAMHAAIEQTEGQPIVVASVLNATSADHSLRNGSNFNVLHWAAYKNSPAAVKVIIERSPNLVNVSMEGECYTALHIAAVNDFVEVAGLLLGVGGANPDSRDNDNRTPLHLAVVQQHKRSIEVLLDKNADVNAVDKDGNTALHLSQNVKPSSKSQAGNETNIQIVYSLLEKGAELYIKNKDGSTPVDLIKDPTMKTMIERLTAAYQKKPTESQSGVRLPIHWSSMKVTEVVNIRLDCNDSMMKQEYGEVVKHFNDTMPNSTIRCVRRVQNALLWEHYNLKKREMESRNGQGSANELHLYHGTSPDIVEHIVHDNFDFRIAGSRVGALYGDGAYFATTSKYSDLYARADDSGYKTMFVAKVLAGKSCPGAPGLKRPPQVDSNDFKKGYFDSVVNSVLSPTIYCVFDRNQYYPEYIIEYR